MSCPSVNQCSYGSRVLEYPHQFHLFFSDLFVQGGSKRRCPKAANFTLLSLFPNVEANLASLGAIPPLSLDVLQDPPLGSQGPFAGWLWRSCLPNEMPVGHADGAFCRCFREAVRHPHSTSLCAGAYRMAVEHPRSWSHSPAAIISLTRVRPGPGLSVAAFLITVYSIALCLLQAPGCASLQALGDLIGVAALDRPGDIPCKCVFKEERGKAERQRGGGRHPHIYAIGRMLQRPPHLLVHLRRLRRLETTGRFGGEGGARPCVERGRRDGRVNGLGAVCRILSFPLLPVGCLGGRR